MRRRCPNHGRRNCRRIYDAVGSLVRSRMLWLLICCCQNTRLSNSSNRRRCWTTIQSQNRDNHGPLQVDLGSCADEKVDLIDDTRQKQPWQYVI